MDRFKEVGGKINLVNREYGFTRCSKVPVETKRGRDREGQERES